MFWGVTVFLCQQQKWKHLRVSLSVLTCAAAAAAAAGTHPQLFATNSQKIIISKVNTGFAFSKQKHYCTWHPFTRSASHCIFVMTSSLHSHRRRWSSQTSVRKSSLEKHQGLEIPLKLQRRLYWTGTNLWFSSSAGQQIVFSSVAGGRPPGSAG